MITISKKEGETMGQLLERTRQEHHIPESEKITFAGRLDPLASGVCIILVGDERFKKEDFTGRSKTYKVTYLEGVGTDTFDPLGIITHTSQKSDAVFSQEILENIFLGTHIFPFPDYSSKVVEGKALWQHARNAHTVVVPETIMTVDHLIYEGESLHTAQEIISTWKERIARVQGDFRQEEILTNYDRALYIDTTLGVNDVSHTTWRRITLVLHVTSGTYIRSFTQALQKYTNTPWTAEYIERISIDDKL